MVKSKKHFPQLRFWWEHLTIQRQIFISFLLVSLISVGIIGSISYRISRDTVENNYRVSHETSLRNSGSVLDMNMDAMVEQIRSFLNDVSLRRVLQGKEDDGKLTFSTTEDGVLKNVAQRITTQASWVNSVAFIDLHGHYYLLDNLNRGTYEFYQYYSEHNVLEEEWTEEVRQAIGRELFYGEEVMAGASGNGFNIAKYMINPSTREPMGYVVVSLSRSVLARSFVMGSEGYDTSLYMIVDHKKGGELVYANETDQNVQEILQAYLSGKNQSKYLFSSVYNDTTQWELVNVIQRDELSSASQRIGQIVLFCAILVVLLGMTLARAISKSITSPLNQLEQVIEKVGQGERHITEDFDDSEVGRIGQKFTEMVNSNLELSEHLLNSRLNEREAELLLLQAQINPHFLYNTLDSLYCVAIIHGDDQIAEMILALSNNFKLALNKGEKFSTVADSIKRLQEYMKLQNMRFHDRFTLNVDVQRDLLPRKILTFILQPFVENALYHGLEPKVGPGSIWIQGWQEGTKMYFTVEDNGVGMDDISVLEKGYGIKNVRERIQLHYGEQYGFTAESTKGKGTKISIVLPVK